jgi:vacuolar-type H+-ATPase subunit D/Vma8
MSVERLEVHPTRQELLRLKRRKTLADGIADILQKDLEVLIISVVEYRERASILKMQLYEILLKSYSQFIEAEMIIGNLKVKELSLTTTPKDVNIKLGKTTGVLGIEFPTIKLVKPKQTIKIKPEQIEIDVETSTDIGSLDIQFPHLKIIERKEKPRLSLYDAPIQLENASSRIYDVMDAVVELASITAAIRELLDVIALKRRQINRIRFKIVPQLDLTVGYIENVLEEIEQQDAIRVRVLQRKRKERAEKSYET